jgi:hypothetical protein
MILLVERIHLQLVGNILVIDFLVGQVPCAQVVQVGLVGTRVLLVKLECGLEIALLLRDTR